jgi:hypothetical protein
MNQKIKRAISMASFLLHTISFSHSQEIPFIGRQLMTELKGKYNIAAYPVSWNNLTDFVLIDDDILIFPRRSHYPEKNYLYLIKYSLSMKKEMEIILPPPEWDEKLIDIKSLAYDSAMNTIHILIYAGHISGRRSDDDASIYYLKSRPFYDNTGGFMENAL